MATAIALISLEEYLHNSYHPDCDFVDGEVQERHLGEREHGRLQGLLVTWLATNEKAWNVYCIPEQRIRITSSRVRVADVYLVYRDAPKEQVIVTPPLLCIEILSPEDPLPHAVRVMEDYAGMGVPNLWLLDPHDRVAYRCTGDGRLQITERLLAIEGTPIHVDLPALFAALD